MDNLETQARATAEKMAERLKSAYVASVLKHPEYYDAGEEADEDDFFAWVENYDWSE